jgi:tetratricopeptide (TPR) repeat protein
MKIRRIQLCLALVALSVFAGCSEPISTSERAPAAGVSNTTPHSSPDGVQDSSPDSQTADQRRRDEIGKRHSLIMDATLLENYPEALQRNEELLEKFPGDPDFLWHKLHLLLCSGQTPDAIALAEVIAAKNADQIPVLNQLAWWLAHSTESSAAAELLPLAESFAQRAVDQSSEQDAACLDTLARVQFLQRDLPEAIRLQQMAVSIAPESRILQTTLAEYQAAQQPAITPIASETPR